MVPLNDSVAHKHMKDICRTLDLKKVADISLFWKDRMTSRCATGAYYEAWHLEI